MWLAATATPEIIKGMQLNLLCGQMSCLQCHAWWSFNVLIWLLCLTFTWYFWGSGCPSSPHSHEDFSLQGCRLPGRSCRTVFYPRMQHGDNLPPTMSPAGKASHFTFFLRMNKPHRSAEAPPEGYKSGALLNKIVPLYHISTDFQSQTLTDTPQSKCKWAV